MSNLDALANDIEEHGEVREKTFSELYITSTTVMKNKPVNQLCHRKSVEITHDKIITGEISYRKDKKDKIELR